MHCRPDTETEEDNTTYFRQQKKTKSKSHTRCVIGVFPEAVRKADPVAWFGPAIILALFLIACEKEFPEERTPAPELSVARLTTTTTEFSALFSWNMDGEVSACGIVWGENENPTLENNDGATIDDPGAGSFSSSLDGLVPGRTYFVRTYIIIENDTIYSEQIKFTPTGLPEVITRDVTRITSVSAVSGAIIEDQGGATVTELGLVWGVGEKPTVTRNEGKIINSDGAAEFTARIQGLKSDTRYYLRAFATNEAGTSYGNQLSFITSILAADIDGNVYTTVIIGEQEWMVENLRVSRYSNGDPIPGDPADPEWQKSGETRLGSIKVYPHAEVPGLDNKIEVLDAYGALYNWHAVNDGRGLCPTGWRVPDNDDWKVLVDYLGGPETAGGKLKSAATDPASHPRWDKPNNDATNESGFTALPGGSRTSEGNFGLAGYHGYWWSATEINIFGAADITIGSRNGNVISSIGNKMNSYSVRCMRDRD
ncbi:MAG: hypothetical protein EA408_10210 [Marinilabiliales bacterium]|nr:MAG: hypothetical protein EA408_10210 [Marinilabiliales bacterium]